MPIRQGIRGAKQNFSIFTPHGDRPHGTRYFPEMRLFDPEGEVLAP